MDELQRISDLRSQLNEWSHQYYVLDAPTVSDYDYDMALRELEQLERIHAAFVDACGRNDGTDAITQDSLFHDAIVRGAHNEYVEEFSHTMILHIQRIKYHYFHCDRLRKISVSQHGEILQTIQARDSARAKELMRSHWLCSMENSLRDVAGMIHGVGGESGQDVLTK